ITRAAGSGRFGAGTALTAGSGTRVLARTRSARVGADTAAAVGKAASASSQLRWVERDHELRREGPRFSTIEAFGDAAQRRLAYHDPAEVRLRRVQEHLNVRSKLGAVPSVRPRAEHVDRGAWTRHEVAPGFAPKRRWPKTVGPGRVAVGRRTA